MEHEGARMTNPGNRRIDRLLAEGFLDDLTEQPARRTSARCGPTPSRRRPTCPICGGCCRVGWTSCAPSSPAGSGGDAKLARRVAHRRSSPTSPPVGAARAGAPRRPSSRPSPTCTAATSSRWSPTSTCRSLAARRRVLSRVLDVLEREEAEPSRPTAARSRHVMDALHRRDRPPLPGRQRQRRRPAPEREQLIAPPPGRVR